MEAKAKEKPKEEEPAAMAGALVVAPRHIPDLNLECITNILRFVASEDFAACMLCCRTWLTAARDPSLNFW